MNSNITDNRAVKAKQAPGHVVRTAMMTALVLCIATLGPLAASAQQMLNDAKAAGQVGETYEGMVALIDEAAPEKVKKMVKATNERRQGRYQSVATIRGSSLESVGLQAGKLIFKKMEPGEMFQSADGKWKKKDAGMKK
jgi:uncharacterized protein YdbL (DUF1318 family)